jgi:hypothetical protein
MPAAVGGNIMTRHPCHSLKRQTWPGYTTLPSFPGSQQRTSRGQQCLLAFLHIAAAAGVFTWTRRYTTHPVEINHYIHSNIQNSHSTYGPHTATPQLDAERERHLDTVGLLNPVHCTYPIMLTIALTTYNIHTSITNCQPTFKKIHYIPLGDTPLVPGQSRKRSARD